MSKHENNQYPEGTIFHPDGSVEYPNGVAAYPNGAVNLTSEFLDSQSHRFRPLPTPEEDEEFWLDSLKLVNTLGGHDFKPEDFT